MIIGARTHDFGVGEDISFAKRVELIKQCGYQSIQLAPAKALDEIPDIHGITMTHIEKIHETLTKASLPVSILGCYIEPAIDDEEERLRNVETFKNNIVFAKALGTSIVGTETTNLSMLKENNRENAYARLLDSVKRMTETAEKEGVFIGIEPVAEHTVNGPEMMKRLIDDVGSDKIKVIFDGPNMLLPETIKQQDAIFESTYKLLGERMEIVHLKNFVIEGGQKETVALDKGVVDLSKILTWLNKNKPNIPVLREESTRATDASDIQFIKSLIDPQI